MDEQIQRGLGWKIAFKRSHADEIDLFREYIEIVHEALERVHASHLDRVARHCQMSPTSNGGNTLRCITPAKARN